MALQGKIVWKSIDIDEAYIAVQMANCSVGYQTTEVLKTAAEFNEDGSLKSEAVYEQKIDKTLEGNFVACVYKNKTSKDDNPNEFITRIHGTYTPKHTSSAKNDVAQAYVALKATDACKDLADA